MVLKSADNSRALTDINAKDVIVPSIQSAAPQIGGSALIHRLHDGRRLGLSNKYRRRLAPPR